MPFIDETAPGGFLTGDQIAAMAETAQGALPDLATIQRPSTVSDGGGGETTTWASLASDVPCRLAPLAGGEVLSPRPRVPSDRIMDQSTAIVTFAAGTDVEDTDRLVIGDLTFDVTLVRRRKSWELARRVEVREAA